MGTLPAGKRLLRGRRTPGFPEGFGEAEHLAGEAAVDEQRVAEAVEVAHAEFVDAALAGEGDCEALGAAADGAAEVQLGVEAGAAGQDEAGQRRQLLRGAVDPGFERGDFGFGDARLGFQSSQTIGRVLIPGIQPEGFAVIPYRLFFVAVLLIRLAQSTNRRHCRG